MLSGNTKCTEMPSSLAESLMPLWRQGGGDMSMSDSLPFFTGGRNLANLQSFSWGRQTPSAAKTVEASPHRHLSVGLWVMWIVQRMQAMARTSW